MCARVGEGYTKAGATLSHCARKAELCLFTYTKAGATLWRVSIVNHK